MKTIIIYYSKTGFTKRYARWLAETLKCDCVPYEDRKKVCIEDYDAVIFGSWLRAGTIQRLKWFQSKIAGMNGKKCIVFAVGAAPAEAKEVVDKVYAQNFPGDKGNNVEFFYLQGGIDYDKMGSVERMAMRMLCKMIGSKKQKTSEDEGMLQMISNSFDATDPKAILPIVKAVSGGRR